MEIKTVSKIAQLSAGSGITRDELFIYALYFESHFDDQSKVNEMLDTIAEMKNRGYPVCYKSANLLSFWEKCKKN